MKPREAAQAVGEPILGALSKVWPLDRSVAHGVVLAVLTEHMPDIDASNGYEMHVWCEATRCVRPFADWAEFNEHLADELVQILSPTKEGISSWRETAPASTEQH